VTQGDIDSPTIFNIIVDAVIRAWKRGKEGDESISQFYADDGLLENTNPEVLQRDLDEIIALFSQVGLKANENKTKFMVVRGAAAPKALSKEVYDNINRRRKGENPTNLTYKERRKLDVSYEVCGKVLKQVSLQRHMLSQHKRDMPTQYVEREIGVRGNYVLMNYTRGSFNECPVPGCSGGGKDTFSVYRHFANRHPDADIEIRGDRDTLKCELCGQRCYDLNKHKQTSTCMKNRTRRSNEIKQTLQAKGDKVRFSVNGKEIERVKKFKYLGRWFREDDSDTCSIKENIRKANGRWNCLANILKREGANAVCMGRFYLTIVQAVLLYGADSWAVEKRDLKRLESFHNRAARYMTGKHIKKRGEVWEYPKHDELLKEAKLLPISKYIERRRGTLRKYLEENRKPLMEEARDITQHCYHANKVLWWRQKYIFKKALNTYSSMWFNT